MKVLLEYVMLAWTATKISTLFERRISDKEWKKFHNIDTWRMDVSSAPAVPGTSGLGPSGISRGSLLQDQNQVKMRAPSEGAVIYL